jgi:hypothetical protein
MHIAESTGNNSYKINSNDFKSNEEKDSTFNKQLEEVSISSSNKENIFEKILKDRTVTEKELNSLSYEQIEQFADYFLKNPTILKTNSNTDIDNNKFFSMMFATKTTANSSFNHALYTTNKMLDDESKRTNLNNELIANLAQNKFGKELMPTFYDSAFRTSPWKVKDINIDFNKFLSDVITMHQDAINNITSKEIQEQHKEILDSYEKLKNNYTNQSSKNIQYI